MAKKKKTGLGFGSNSEDNNSGNSEEIKSVKENTLNAFEAFKALINQKNDEFSAASHEESAAAEATAPVSAEEPEEKTSQEEVEVSLSSSEEITLEASGSSAEDAADQDSNEEADATESMEDGEESQDELAEFGSTNIFTEEEPESFLPESDEAEMSASEEALPHVESVEGTELDAFESADIEELEFVEEEQLDSIVESILFASDRPVSLNSLKMVFKGTNIKGDKIKRALDRLAVELAGARRGVSLEEVPGGFQLRTKVDNMQFLTRTLKARQFKLSGPALEVLAIIAYKQPVVKHEVDEIRGVESGHLLRALMEKGLVNFEGKSDLPGKPMLYATTRKFLEIFGLRNLQELPTLSQIDELLPDGMTEEEAKPTLSQVTDSMSQTIGSSYSEGEDELMKIEDQLGNINTSSEFFEQEKLRQKQKRDADKAQNLREAIAMGEAVATRDRNWLARYDEALMAGTLDQFEVQEKKEAAQEEKAVELDFIEDDNSGVEMSPEAEQSAASTDEDDEPTPGEANL
jgi:segregation and condensation protein B